MLAPFATLDEVTAAVPKIVASGIGPLLVEYIDIITMAAIAQRTYGVELGVDPATSRRRRSRTSWSCSRTARDDRLDENTEELASLLAEPRRARRVRAARRPRAPS